MKHLVIRDIFKMLIRCFLYAVAFLIIAISIILFLIKEEKKDPFVIEIEKQLFVTGHADFSKIGNIKKICIFYQDDSDENVALNKYMQYIKENSITVINKVNFDNPDYLLLLENGRTGQVLIDPVFDTGNNRYHIWVDGLEEIRDFCFMTDKAVLNLSDNRLKLKLGIAEGKKKYEKRETMKERDRNRDKARIMKGER